MIDAVSKMIVGRPPHVDEEAVNYNFIHGFFLFRTDPGTAAFGYPDELDSGLPRYRRMAMGKSGDGESMGICVSRRD